MKIMKRYCIISKQFTMPKYFFEFLIGYQIQGFHQSEPISVNWPRVIEKDRCTKQQKYFFNIIKAMSDNFTISFEWEKK